VGAINGHYGLLIGASGAGGGIDPFVAVTHVTGASGSSISAAVPVGAASGDTLVLVVRVRGDRSVTVPPTGSTTLIDQTIGDGSPGQRQRVYVFTKAYVADTTMSCTHSASAAHGVSLYVVRGTVVNSTAGQVSSNTQNITITKTGTNNGLLALGLVIAGSGFTTANPALSGWAQRGTDYFDASNYFGVGYSRGHSGASATANIGAGVTLGGTLNPNCVVLLEVQP
jgi:hypothetical protein